MNWVEMDIYTTTEGIEAVTGSLLGMGINGFVIKDAKDFQDFLDDKDGNWDYIDDDLMGLKNCETTVTVYLPENAQGLENLEAMKLELKALKKRDVNNEFGRLEYELKNVKEEDWANNWKQYYKPLKIGNRIVICPAWETYTPTGNELVVRMDPGMAFGTGTHETTRLMIRLLEDYTQPGCRMLDVGTGTGILAICASRLGVGVCRAYDIDPTAVRVARENIRESGLTNITCDRSDLLRQVDLHDGRYDLITANIVADILIRMMPDVGAYLAPDGVLLLSGIVEERCADVIASADANGYSVETRLPDNGWCALALRRKR